jgi:hypothetical protein
MLSDIFFAVKGCERKKLLFVFHLCCATNARSKNGLNVALTALVILTRRLVNNTVQEPALAPDPPWLHLFFIFNNVPNVFIHKHDSYCTQALQIVGEVSQAAQAAHPY